MDAGKILHELTYAEGLPKEALKAASAQHVEMLPLFVQIPTKSPADSEMMSPGDTR